MVSSLRGASFLPPSSLPSLRTLMFLGNLRLCSSYPPKFILSCISCNFFPTMKPLVRRSNGPVISDFYVVFDLFYSFPSYPPSFCAETGRACKCKPCVCNPKHRPIHTSCEIFAAHISVESYVFSTCCLGRCAFSVTFSLVLPISLCFSLTLCNFVSFYWLQPSIFSASFTVSIFVDFILPLLSF